MRTKKMLWQIWCSHVGACECVRHRLFEIICIQPAYTFFYVNTRISGLRKVFMWWPRIQNSIKSAESNANDQICKELRDRERKKKRKRLLSLVENVSSFLKKKHTEIPNREAYVRCSSVNARRQNHCKFTVDVRDWWKIAENVATHCPHYMCMHNEETKILTKLANLNIYTLIIVRGTIQISTRNISMLRSMMNNAAARQ